MQLEQSKRSYLINRAATRLVARRVGGVAQVPVLARRRVPVADVEVVVPLRQLCKCVVNDERGGSIQIQIASATIGSIDIYLPC